MEVQIQCSGGANTACHVRAQVPKPLIIRHRCSKCSCHRLKIITMTIIIITNVDNFNHENVDNGHHENMDNNGCTFLTTVMILKNYDDDNGLTKESCRTLYWRIWLGKPGQRGVQIGFEKARAHIWAFDARPSEYPMPHKAPAVMESDIEWYKAIGVFTELACLLITAKKKATSIKWGLNMAVKAEPRPSLHLQWFTQSAIKLQDYLDVVKKIMQLRCKHCSIILIHSKCNCLQSL